MYAIGSKEELFALVRHLRISNRIARGSIEENDKFDKFDALEALGTTDMILAMLEDALNDHFNGRN